MIEDFGQERVGSPAWEPTASELARALRRLLRGDRDFFESTSPRADLLEPARPELDRRGFFERCWPGAGQGQGIDIVRLIESGDEVIVTYELKRPGRQRGRGCNDRVLTFDGEQVKRIEVYFGWDLRAATCGTGGEADLPQPGAGHRDPGRHPDRARARRRGGAWRSPGLHRGRGRPGDHLRRAGAAGGCGRRPAPVQGHRQGGRGRAGRAEQPAWGIAYHAILRAGAVVTPMYALLARRGDRAARWRTPTPSC